MWILEINLCSGLSSVLEETVGLNLSLKPKYSVTLSCFYHFMARQLALTGRSRYCYTISVSPSVYRMVIVCWDYCISSHFFTVWQGHPSTLYGPYRHCKIPWGTPNCVG